MQKKCILQTLICDKLWFVIKAWLTKLNVYYYKLYIRLSVKFSCNLYCNYYIHAVLIWIEIFLWLFPFPASKLNNRVCHVCTENANMVSVVSIVSMSCCYLIYMHIVLCRQISSASNSFPVLQIKRTIIVMI